MSSPALKRPSRHVALPKHAQLATQLRRQIENGVLQPGDRLPTFAEMRAQFGISQDVLERMHGALEAEGLVVRQARRGIFVAPQKSARALTGVIGFAGIAERSFAGERSAYWSPLVEGIQEAAHAVGSEILLLHANSQISANRVDGVLMSGAHEEVLQRLPAGMPCVSLVNETDEVACVMADDFGGARDITRWLIELGHRRIACLTLTCSLESARRIAGYRAALDEAGIAFEMGLVRPMIFEEPRMGFAELGHLNVCSWLTQDWHELAPTALFCHNDDTAVGAIAALQAAGMRVPHDLSVAGFDGLESGAAAWLHLTTARVPLHDIGARGVELLLQQTQGKATERKLVLPTPLQAGQTSARIETETHAV